MTMSNADYLTRLGQQSLREMRAAGGRVDRMPDEHPDCVPARDWGTWMHLGAFLDSEPWRCIDEGAERGIIGSACEGGFPSDCKHQVTYCKTHHTCSPNPYHPHKCGICFEEIS